MTSRHFDVTSVVAVGALAAIVAVAGCSSTELVTKVIGDGGTHDGGAAREAGDDEEASRLPEERTVGKPCSTSKDCAIDGSVGDNYCSADKRDGVDDPSATLSTPVCVSACTVPSEDDARINSQSLYCDDQVGLCVGSPGSQGVCVGVCRFDSYRINIACAGNNRCTPEYVFASAPSYGIGYCAGGCSDDEDCKGPSGQKCDKDTGACVTTLPEPDTKGPGEACKKPASSTEKAECLCSVVGGTGATKDNGFCTRRCTTVAAFDEPDAGAEEVDGAAPVPDACDAWLKGWRCTAGLPTQGTAANGSVYELFTGQPPGLTGECRRPCSTTEDCADLAAATGANVECREFAWRYGKPARFCSMAP